jgi:TldD protein
MSVPIFLRRRSTRRDFLTTTSLAAAGALLALPRSLAGSVVTTSLDTSRSAEHWLEPSVPDTLRSLATRAIDAATHAGASYADVRFSEQQVMRPTVDAAIGRSVQLTSQCLYGVRARVNGVWGFAYGRVPTADAVARCAQDAVMIARTAAQLAISRDRRNSADAWRPASSVTGEWRSSMQVDPFTVPLQEYAELITALMMATGYVSGALFDVKVRWERETRVFAASTGSLLTQYRHIAKFDNNNHVIYGHNWVGFRIPEFHGASVGLELLRDPALQDRIKALAEDAEKLTRLPVGTFDVGRYPVVCDGVAMGAVLTCLIGPALELDRVLGDEHDTAGTSPLSIDQLGTPVTSPLLTITAHRSAPSITAARWDDDGAEVRRHTVIRDGRLTDFHTDGHTVSALQPWYQRHGLPMTSNGCGTAVQSSNLPLLQSPHLTMTPANANVSLDDLCKDVKRGLLLVNQDWIAPDQQLTSATIFARLGSYAAGDVQAGGMLFEIAQGQIVRRIKQTALQLHTLPFLKGMTAIGGAQTVCDTAAFTSKGMPWQTAYKGTTAPAALFKEVDAITVGNR